MNWSGSECVTACDISVYHSGVAEHSGLLGCDAVSRSWTAWLFLNTTLGFFETSETTNPVTLRHIPDHLGSASDVTFREFDHVYGYLSCTGALDWSKLHSGLLLSCLRPSFVSFLSFKSFLILSSLFPRQYNEFDYISSLQVYSFEHWDAICVNTWKLRVSMATSLERRNGLI
jgi:hypothetical protein